MSGWMYKRTESQLWTVGYVDPDSGFEPESDHGSPDEAAERVAVLNGGGNNRALIEALREEVAALSTQLESLTRQVTDQARA